MKNKNWVFRDCRSYNQFEQRAAEWRPNSAYTALIHLQGRAVDIDNAVQSLYHIKGVCPSVNNFIANPKRLFENYKFKAKHGV